MTRMRTASDFATPFGGSSSVPCLAAAKPPSQPWEANNGKKHRRTRPELQLVTPSGSSTPSTAKCPKWSLSVERHSLVAPKRPVSTSDVKLPPGCRWPGEPTPPGMSRRLLRSEEHDSNKEPDILGSLDLTATQVAQATTHLQQALLPHPMWLGPPQVCLAEHHEYGRRVGMVPRSSLKGGKNSLMVEKETEKPNTTPNEQNNKTQGPQAESPPSCSLSSVQGETCETRESV